MSEVPATSISDRRIENPSQCPGKSWGFSGSRTRDPLSCPPHEDAALRRPCAGARPMARIALRLVLSAVMSASLATIVGAQGKPGADWPSANYANSANRYSPLDQITAQN